MSSVLISSVHTPFLHPSLPTKLCGWGLYVCISGKWRQPKGIFMDIKKSTWLDTSLCNVNTFSLTCMENLWLHMIQPRRHVQHDSESGWSGMFCCRMCYWLRGYFLHSVPRTRIGIEVLLTLAARELWHMASRIVVAVVVAVVAVTCLMLFRWLWQSSLNHLQTFLDLCFRSQQLLMKIIRILC